VAEATPKQPVKTTRKESFFLMEMTDVDDESNICHVSLSSNPICSSFRFLSLLYG
jgi:hypothetical protein